MPPVEIDCNTYRDRCDDLRRVVLGGLSAERLQALGIQPGSERALRLEHGIWDIFLRCCARRAGPLPPERPELPYPPPPPETPEPLPDDGSEPVLAAGAALALPAEGSALAELLAWLRATGARIHPLTLLVMIAAAGGAAAATQTCKLERSRINEEGVLECLYVCPNGDTYYTYDYLGVGACLPFIIRGV